MLNDRVILQDFPDISRHWPTCALGCIEAICKYQFGTPPLADCQYDHTFHYERRRGGILRDAEGTNLDLEFHATPGNFGATTRRVREAHGIEIRHHSFFSVREFEAFALEALRERRALVVVFDWFYMEGRREYQRIHAPHCACVVGIEVGGGPVHLVDQYCGRLKIPGEAFADFLAFSAGEGRDGAEFMAFDRRAAFTPPHSNRLVELGINIEHFLDNLQSTDSARGLAALQAFKDEINAFMDAERAAPAVFYVPGLWQHAPQRAHFAEALRVIERVHPEFTIPDRDELMRGLEVLYRSWFDLNLNAEAGLITNRPPLIAKAFAGLDAIIGHEREIPGRLERVLRALK
jgi:hypothetical protein